MSETSASSDCAKWEALDPEAKRAAFAAFFGLPEEVFDKDSFCSRAYACFLLRASEAAGEVLEEFLDQLSEELASHSQREQQRKPFDRKENASIQKPRRQTRRDTPLSTELRKVAAGEWACYWIRRDGAQPWYAPISELLAIHANLSEASPRES